MSFERHYHTTDKNIWQGRVDADGEQRFHQIIKRLDLNDQAFKDSDLAAAIDYKKIALLGFCSDEGVRRNQGRIGAKDGPRFLRNALSNLPQHNKKINLFDAGDVFCHAEDLEEAQEALGIAVNKLIGQHYFPIILGGGHETAFGHFLGLDKAFKKEKIGVINFDAHFDLRELEEGKGTSGTPFLQISQMVNEFDYLCLGINKSSNTAKLFETAKKLKVKHFSAAEVNEKAKSVKDELKSFIDRNERIYITVCLDAFDSAFAPGVSAPAVAGILPHKFLPIFKDLISSKKVIALDIVELSPKFDMDGRTAKLAANIIFEFIMGSGRVHGYK